MIFINVTKFHLTGKLVELLIGWRTRTRCLM